MDLAWIVEKRSVISAQTVWKWRKRDSVHDLSHTPHKLQTTLTPAQEAAWTRYTSAHQPPQRGARPDRDAWSKLTTPQRLDQMQAHKAERDAHMAQAMEATRALYAALNAEQQKLFDSQAPMAGMGMRGKAQGEHRHGGMRHGG